jgi:N-acyl-phosphatidylethanolamine-hydrolysing phospholipase D
MLSRSSPFAKRFTTRPAHHANDAGTAFKNPWPSADLPTWAELASNPFPLGWALSELQSNPKVRDVKVVRPDWGEAHLGALLTDRWIVATWLGHAAVLVQMPLEGTLAAGGLVGGPAGEKKRLWMLFDPMFSTTAGPTQWTGPRRFRETPCQVADLPGCDVVFVSHNHYDHLDFSSIVAILKRFPQARYFVPLGNKSWFIETGVPEELVNELDWWQDREFRPEDFGHQPPQDETRIKVTCVPAQHNSGRAGRDAGSTLWCGWAVEQFVRSKEEVEKVEGRSTSRATRKGAIYHAGDTGYRRSAKSDVVCPAFKEIGKKLGPFDLSFIPIWRGGTLGFVSYLGLRLSHDDVPSTLHGSPTDAVAIHRDVKSRNTIGVHFGTFIGSENESHEAIIEFGEACDEAGVRSLDDRVEGDHGRAGTLDIGGSLVVEIA